MRYFPLLALVMVIIACNISTGNGRISAKDLKAIQDDIQELKDLQDNIQNLKSQGVTASQDQATGYGNGEEGMEFHLVQNR